MPVGTALPASGPGVNLQLSSAMTLTGWVMISLFDALVLSGLSLGLACGISNAFNTMYAASLASVMGLPESALPYATRQKCCSRLICGCFTATFQFRREAARCFVGSDVQRLPQPTSGGPAPMAGPFHFWRTRFACSDHPSFLADGPSSPALFFS